MDLLSDSIKELKNVKKIVIIINRNLFNGFSCEKLMDCLKQLENLNDLTLRVFGSKIEFEGCMFIEEGIK